MRIGFCVWLVIANGLVLANIAAGFTWQDPERSPVIPHNQDRLPNEAYSPTEALAAMQVPEGFTAELVASEPDLINPIAMTFDERGRLWVTESFEYPRREAGVGRDRIKILEDTNGDGKFDSVKIFVEGLNIPSGIAVGHGGVWVANSPDILFMKDTNGDDRADQIEVVVSGFGRDDTHELPNSLSWGPDGYLYGLNGVFNYSTIRQDGLEFKFTCAMFRIDPHTRQFEVFAEGTSNPWGIAFDDEGEAFVSACVIDHLWHITESGYYLRQAGAYPPHTWIIDSIVDHKHFKAAYCGIHYFDSPAYPEAYRKKMYMGNIHGGSINVDQLQRHGSTYKGSGNDDLLQANDVWFMPVAQKTGPDGCLYVLDWYDRYHCYQDANRDPEGIDRAKGRLYRIRYGESPRAARFNLAAESDVNLIDRLGDANIYFRSEAQRVLTERLVAGQLSDEGRRHLLDMATGEQASSDARRHACWVLVGGRSLDLDTWKQLTRSADPVLRGFAIRAAGNYASLRRTPELQGQWQGIAATEFPALASDLSPAVRVSLMVAARKALGEDALDVLLEAGDNVESDDGLLPRILWQNLLALVQVRPAFAVEIARHRRLPTHRFVADLTPRLANFLVEHGELVAALELAAGIAPGDVGDIGRQRILQAIEKRVLNGELPVAQLRESLAATTVDLSVLKSLGEFERLMAAVGESVDVEVLIQTVADATRTVDQRRAAFSTLAFVAQDPRQAAAFDACLKLARQELLHVSNEALTNHIVDQLVRLTSPAVATLLVEAVPKVAPATRSRVIEALTTRAESAKVLFAAMELPESTITRALVNETQVQRLISTGDAELIALIEKNWGTMRVGHRGLLVDEMTRVRRIVRDVPGDFNRGWVAYDRVCGQCHQFAGRGEKVGPSIDSNGRASLTQLLSNMIDPNLVIGIDYQARMVMTSDGRVFSGLVVEDTPQRLVLNLQGGKTVSLPREEIEQEQTSPNSLMPEGQTFQMTDQEIADLMSILLLNDPLRRDSGRIPEGSVQAQTQTSPDRYHLILPEAFADFTCENTGFAGGLALLEEHENRAAVVRSHPVAADRPTVFRRSVQLPATPMLLRLGVSHHPKGAWRLKVKINDEEIHDQIVDETTSRGGWLDLELNLSAYVDQAIALQIENHGHDKNEAFAYWSHVYIGYSADELPDMALSQLQADMQPEYEDPRKQEPVFPVPDHWVKLSPDYPVFADLQAKQVIVDGQIIQNHAMLEMFACPIHSGKDHESIVGVFSNSRLVHAALLAVGAKVGKPASFDPEFKPASGTTIRIKAEWEDEQKQRQSIDVKQWIRNIQTKEVLQVDWVFGGSMIYKDPDTGREYYMAEGGELICVSNFSTATMDLPAASSAEAVNQVFEANTDKIPPLGTPVRLFLVPEIKPE